MLTAFGLGIAFPTVSIAVTAGIPARQQGVAGGLFVTAQQVGAAAGLAVLATVADARTRAAHGSLVAGYQLSFLVAVGFIAAAAAIVLIQLRRTTSAPRPAVPASPVGTLAASAAVPPHPATVGFTKPEPADQCPLTRCGLGATCTLPAMTPPERVPSAAVKRPSTQVRVTGGERRALPERGRRRPPRWRRAHRHARRVAGRCATSLASFEEPSELTYALPWRLLGADDLEVLVDEDVVRPVDTDVVDLVLAVAQ